MVFVVFCGCDSGIVKNEEFTRNTLGNNKALENLNISLSNDEVLVVNLAELDSSKQDSFTQSLSHIKASLKTDKESSKRAILLVFFATWCEPCLAQIPHLNNLKSTFKDNLEIIGVLVKDTRNEENMRHFATKENPLDFPYIQGQSAEAKQFLKILGMPNVIPLMVLYDKNGEYFTYYLGAVLEEMLELDIKRLLK